MATPFFKKKLQFLKEKDATESLIKEVAEELDLPIVQVKEIILNGQSKFTASVMKSNSFDGVRWPYLGKFTAKVKAAQVLKHLKGLTPIQREFFLSREENKKYRK